MRARIVAVVAAVGLGACIVACGLPDVEERQAQPVKPSESKTPAPEAPKWHPMGSTLELGDFQVSVSRVEFGKVPLVSFLGEDAASANPHLMIWLAVQNTTENKKLEFDSWAAEDFDFLEGDNPTLQDDVGNTYKRISFDNEIRGIESGSVYPGKGVVDAVVFERPVDGINFLRLTLPGRALSEDGELRFEIPISSVTGLE